MPTTSPTPTPPVRRLLRGAPLASLVLAVLLAACGEKAPEADSAGDAATAPAGGQSTAATADETAAGPEQKVDRAARRSREALDRLAGVVDGLAPDQRLDFNDPIAELERRRDAALATAAELTAAGDEKPARLRRLARELSQVADEAAALAERAEAVAGGTS